MDTLQRLGSVSQTRSGATTATTTGYWGLICALLQWTGPKACQQRGSAPVHVVHSTGR